MSYMLDANHEWLKGVRRIDSPNCDEREIETIIDTVVIHGISLPPGEYGGPYIDQLFTNCLDCGVHPFFNEINDLKVSAHLLINRSGNITQYVPFSKRARHAGESELDGRTDCNEFSIGIELEGSDEQPYERIQYEVLAGVVSVLKETWPGICRKTIVGHSQIAPGRKTDPGPAFDWDYFFSLLGGE